MTMESSYLLGLFFIFLVIIIWSLASVLVQHIFHDLDFDSPFMLTYICTSLFVVLLPSRLIWEKVQYTIWNWNDRKESKNECDAHRPQIVPWRSGTLLQSYQLISMNDEKNIDLDEEENHKSNSNEGESGTENTNANNDDSPSSSNEDFILGHYETLRISMIIAPIWFFSNYFYNLSLDYTSIASSTIIASTGSLFTFLIAVYMKDETFTIWRCLGVGLCVGGSVITGLKDSLNTTNDGPNSSFWGDAAGLLSAIGYGVYTICIRIKCPKDEKHISMQLLFGYIGLLNMILLSPAVLFQYFMYQQSLIREQKMNDNGEESLMKPWITWTILGWLVLKGLFDNVLSDYLWARSVILTSATVATVGLGLTIPFAFLSDWLIGNIKPTLTSVTGALSVLIGFILVNVDVGCGN